jgi:hypothetical protein
MALRNGRRREGSVKATRSVRVHRSAAESLDGFFPSLPDRCLKRGHSTKKEIRSTSLLLYARTRVRAGRCGAGTGPAEEGTGLSVVDLTNLPSVPSIFESGPRESLRFLHRFMQEVSQPFEPDAEIHIEYTPTQVASEFFRHRLHDAQGHSIRGLVYGSAKRTGAVNLALFIESSESGRCSDRNAAEERTCTLAGFHRGDRCCEGASKEGVRDAASCNRSGSHGGEQTGQLRHRPQAAIGEIAKPT